MPRFHASGSLIRITLSALVLFGATAINAQQQQSKLPDWLQQAMAREATGLKSTPLALGDSTYHFELPGESLEPTAFDGGWYIASDIGGDSPLECYLFTDSLDLATLVVNLAEGNIEAQAEANDGTVGDRNVTTLDAGAIGSAPYLAIELLFTIGEGENALAGVTKVRAASNGNITQACAQNDVGYRETLRQAFENFVHSTSQPATAVEPYYEDIAIISLGAQPIGFAKYSYTLDDEGDTAIVGSTSTLMSLGAGALRYEDSSTIGWSTPDGLLINASTSKSQNGELISNLEMSRNEGDDWLVSGSFQSKALETVIDGSSQPVSELGEMRFARTLFSGEAAATTFPVWVPDADPTRLLEASLVKSGSPDARSGKLTVGPTEFDARFDAHGAMTWTEVKVGALVMSINRVWHRGEPR